MFVVGGVGMGWIEDVGLLHDVCFIFWQTNFKLLLSQVNELAKAPNIHTHTLNTHLMCVCVCVLE